MRVPAGITRTRNTRNPRLVPAGFTRLFRVLPEYDAGNCGIAGKCLKVRVIAGNAGNVFDF